MSTFSTKISDYIKMGGFNIIALSEASGISVALLSKIKTGKRLCSDEDKVRKLIHALRITSAQEKELIDEYHIERIGHEKYECFLEIRQIICQLANPIEDPFIERRESSYQFEYNPCFTGEENINILSQYVIDTELAEKHPHIALNGTGEFAYTRDYLLHALLQHKNCDDVKIDHIVELHSSYVSSSGYENMKRVHHILKLANSCRGYRPNFYYSDNSLKQIYPYCILTKKYAMCVNTNADKAMLLQDPQMLKSMWEEFETLKNKTYPLLCRRETEDYKSHILSDDRFNEGLNTFIDIAMQPCLGKVIPQKLMIAHGKIAPGSKDYATILSKVKNYFGVDMHGISICPIKGITDFLEHGILYEIPGEWISPFTPDEALIILELYSAQLAKGQDKLYFLKDEKLVPSSYGSFQCINKKEIQFLHTKEDGKQVSYTLEEDGTKNTVLEYLQYLIESENTYSAEESQAMFSNILLQYKKDRVNKRKALARAK